MCTSAMSSLCFTDHLQLLRIFITFTDRLGTLAHSIEDLTKEFQDAEEQLKKVSFSGYLVLFLQS